VHGWLGRRRLKPAYSATSASVLDEFDHHPE
jgi:hypothetical protein